MTMSGMQRLTPPTVRRERKIETVINQRREEPLRPVQEEAFEISANTLQMLDEAMKNLKEGLVSEPIKLD